MISAMFLCASLVGANSVKMVATVLAWDPPPDSAIETEDRDRVAARMFDSLALLDLPKQPTVAKAQAFLEKWLPRARNGEEIGFLVGRFHCTYSGDLCLDYPSRQQILGWLVRYFRKESRQSFRDAFSDSKFLSGGIVFKQEDRSMVKVRPGDTVRFSAQTASQVQIPVPASVSFEVGRIGFHGFDTVEVEVLDTIRAFPMDDGGSKWQLEDTLPGPGLFRMTRLGKEEFQDVFVNSTWLEATVLRSARSLVVFATSFDPSLKPPFHLVVRFPDRKWQEIWTDSTGTARLELRKDYEGHELTMVLEGGGNVAFAEDPSQNGSSVDWGSFLWSDRPVYRPGELVHLGGTVLGVDKHGRNRRTIVDSVQLEVKALNLSRDVALNTSGQFTDTIRIPEGQAPSKMEACTKVAYRYDEMGRYSVRDWCMEWLVEGVRKTSFEVVAIPRMEATVQGDSAVVDIRTRNFDGSPVAGGIAKVSWQLSPDAKMASYGRRASEVLEQRTVALDALGAARVRIPTSHSGEIWDMPVTIAVTDPAQRVEQVSVKVPIWTSRLRAEVVFSPDPHEHGDSIQALVVLRDQSFQPVAGWIRVRHQAAGDVVLDTLVHVGESGACTLRILPRGAELEKLELASSMQASAPWVLQSWEVPYPSDPDWQRVGLGKVSGRIRPGDTVRMVVRNLKPGQSALATVEKGELLQDHFVQADGSGQARLSIPVDSGMVPKFLVRVWHADREKIDSDQEIVFVEDSAKDKGLALDVPSAKAPGAQVVVRLRLRDGHGRPIGGRFSLSVADDAIWQIPSGWDRESVLPDRDVGDHIGSLGSLSVSDGRWLSNRELWFLEVLNRRIPAPSGGSVRPGIPPSGKSLKPIHPGQESRAVRSFASRRDGRGFISDRMKEPAPGSKPMFRGMAREFSYWSDSVVVGSDGTGEATFVLPKEAATWRIVVRGMDDSAIYHEKTTMLDSRQQVWAEIDAPMLLVETDTAWIGGILRNPDAAPRKTTISFEAGFASGQKSDAIEKEVEVGPGSTVQVGWPVIATGSDSLLAVLRTSTNGISETSRVAIPVARRSVEHVAAGHGRLDSVQPNLAVDLGLPPSSRAVGGTWQVKAAGGILPSLEEPLKYLREFPHAGPEQTMSRLVPRLQYASGIQKAGIPEDSLERDLEPSDSATIEKIRMMKGSQRDWGWWEGANPQPDMTLLVLDGLQKARAEIALQSTTESKSLVGTLDRMLKEERYPLMNILREKKNPYALRLQALKVVADSGMGEDPDLLRKELAEIWERRDSLGVVALAFALEASHRIGFADLEKDALDRIRKKTRNGISRYGLGTQRFWPMDSGWSWAGDSVESSALVLGALARTGNDSSLSKPVIAWLQEQKQNGHWGSTRATARVLDAIFASLASHPEAPSRGTLKVHAGKRLVASLVIDGARPDLAMATCHLTDAQAKSGLRLEFQGVGAIQWTLAKSWQDASQVRRAQAGELSVRRLYRKVGLESDASGRVQESLIAFDGGLRLGEELEVTIELESRSAGEYLMLEDHVPAGMAISSSGFERLLGRGSWLTYGKSAADKMTWFLSEVRPGLTRFSYRLRAKHPGVYHALPARAELMYRPAVRANSEETLVRIRDR